VVMERMFRICFYDLRPATSDFRLKKFNQVPTGRKLLVILFECVGESYERLAT